jgi:putative sterol carrier protein
LLIEQANRENGDGAVLKKEMTPMTMNELFEAMPARLNTAAAANVNKTVQWNITGEDAGVWAIQIIKGTARLIPGGAEKPDVTFTIKDKDWLAIAEGKLSAMNAFMMGKLKVAGDMTLALKVPQLLPLE